MTKLGNSTKVHSDINMDVVLAEVGHFGLYQFFLFALIIFPVMCCAMYSGQYVFNAGDVNYRCFVPECEPSPGNWKPGAWAEFALVPGSKCTRYAPILQGDKTLCDKNSFSKNIMDCTAWVYESKNTIVAEFDLACQDWKRASVGTVHSLGIFTAHLYIGVLSDNIGRRTTFILASICGPLMGIIRSFSTSYVMYVIFEYFDAGLGAGTYSSGFVLVVEMVGKHKRVLCGSIMGSIFASGLMLLALVAWAVPYWRTLIRVIYSPSLIVLLYFFCLSESVRWLISKDKHDKAIHVLEKVAHMNGRKLSTRTIEKITDSAVRQSEQVQKIPVWRQVTRSKILISRLFICSFTWMTVTFTYYGLTINSVSLLGNIYLNYALTALVEIPGYIVCNFMLDRFGRKRSIMAALFCCAVSLFFVPIFPARFRIIPTLLAKSCISMSFVAVYIFTMELFPTSARHTLMSVCSLVGRIGSVMAPLSPLLLKVRHWLPYVLFGCVCAVAAFLIILTPETHERPLPDTVEQAERISLSPKRPAVEVSTPPSLPSPIEPSTSLPAPVASTSKAAAEK